MTLHSYFSSTISAAGRDCKVTVESDNQRIHRTQPRFRVRSPTTEETFKFSHLLLCKITVSCPQIGSKKAVVPRTCLSFCLVAFKSTFCPGYCFGEHSYKGVGSRLLGLVTQYQSGFSHTFSFALTVYTHRTANISAIISHVCTHKYHGYLCTLVQLIISHY